MYVIGHRNGNVYTVMNGMVQAQPFLHVAVSAGGRQRAGPAEHGPAPELRAPTSCSTSSTRRRRRPGSRIDEFERTDADHGDEEAGDLQPGAGSGRYHNGGSIYFNPKDTEPLAVPVGRRRQRPAGAAGSPTATRGRILKIDTGVRKMASCHLRLRPAEPLPHEHRPADRRHVVGDVANGRAARSCSRPSGTDGTNFGYDASGGPTAASAAGRAARRAPSSAAWSTAAARSRACAAATSTACTPAAWSSRSSSQGGTAHGRHVTTTATLTVPGNISSFGEDGEGEIWMSSMGGNCHLQDRGGRPSRQTRRR